MFFDLARIERSARSGVALVVLVAASAACVVAWAGPARAERAFAFDDEPIHPGCIHALVMQDGDSIPVTTSISLRGCKASHRSRAAIIRAPDGTLSIEDPALLGEGQFGYRHLSTLKNGIFILGITRTLPDGTSRLSIAAVEITSRPMLLRGEIADTTLLEVIGEAWIKDIEFGSLRTIGNTIHFSAGVGPARTQDSIDLTRIEKARD